MAESQARVARSRGVARFRIVSASSICLDIGGPHFFAAVARAVNSSRPNAPGPTFYQLHLLFDKHYDEQSELVDSIAERIQLLGGVSVAMAHDVAETTLIPRAPKGRETVPVQLSRLLHAHEIVLKEARAMSRRPDLG
jgi:ferritin-like protein